MERYIKQIIVEKCQRHKDERKYNCNLGRCEIERKYLNKHFYIIKLYSEKQVYVLIQLFSVIGK